MKHVTEKEIISAVPISTTPIPPIMTRYDKLQRWADIIAQCDLHIMLLDRLESWEKVKFNIPLSEMTYYTPCQIEDNYYNDTAFQVAARDPLFKEMGLVETVASAMNFFEINQHELHEFTCNCGGQISNKTMVRRIRNVADPTWIGWVRNFFK